LFLFTQLCSSFYLCKLQDVKENESLKDCDNELLIESAKIK
jgi:hypothetical protein